MATRRRRWPQACPAGGCSAPPARPSGRRRCAPPGSSRSTGRDAAAVDGGDRRGRRACWSSLPPDAAGDPVLARHARALAAAPARLGRLSLDHRRLWRPAGRLGRRGEPARAGARARPLAGGGGSRMARDRPAGEVFRLAGIYGPGRSVLDRLREGRAQRVVKPGQVFSRIHVDDIAGVLARRDGAAGAGARPTTSPTTSRRRREDVIAFAAELLGVAAAAGGRLRGGRALADGAELLERSRSGSRTGGSARSSGSRSPVPTIARACAASSRPAAEGSAQQAWRKSDAGRFPVLAFGRRIGQRIGKVGIRRPDGAIEVGGMPQERLRAGVAMLALAAAARRARHHRAGAGGRAPRPEPQPLRRHRPDRHAERRGAARRAGLGELQPVRQHRSGATSPSRCCRGCR